MAGLAGMGISTPSKFDATDVNDQLGKTLNKGGLLMRMAQSKGQQVASSRGLSNSTIGIDAAQRAVVDAALPIAQQNAQQTHQRVMQGSDQQQQITMLDKQQGWQGNQNSLDRQQQLNMQSNQFGQDKNMANLNASLQKQRDDLLYQQQLGTLDAQGKQRLQELDKQFQTQSALNNQQNQFSAAQSALDRNQQLTMQSNEFKNQSALTNQQAQLQQQRDQLLYKQQLGTLDKQGQLQLQQLDKQLSNQQALNNQQFGQQKQLNEQQAYLQAERDGLLYKQSLGTLDAQGKQRLQELDKQFQTQSALNNQQFGQQKELNKQQAYLQAERDTLQNKFQQGILDKEGKQRLTELDKQLSNQKALNEQQNRYNSAEAQKDRAQQLTMLEKNASKDLAYMAQQVAANTHGMYLSAIDSQVTSYNERIAALEADQTIKTTDKPAMKAGMEKELNATLQMYGTLYSNINTIRPDWTQFPTKELPKVGAGQTTGTVVAPIKPKTPTSGEVAARATGTKPPVGTMLPTNVAAPIKPNVVTTTKAPTPAELAARATGTKPPVGTKLPTNVAAPIKPIK